MSKHCPAVSVPSGCPRGGSQGGGAPLGLPPHPLSAWAAAATDPLFFIASSPTVHGTHGESATFMRPQV